MTKFPLSTSICIFYSLHDPLSYRIRFVVAAGDDLQLDALYQESRTPGFPDFASDAKA